MNKHPFILLVLAALFLLLQVQCRKDDPLPPYPFPDGLTCYGTRDGLFNGFRNGIPWCGDISIADNRHVNEKWPLDMGFGSQWGPDAFAELIGPYNIVFDSIARYPDQVLLYSYGIDDEFLEFGNTLITGNPDENFLQIDSIRADGKRYYGHLHALVHFKGYEAVEFEGSFWFDIE
ncbi:MAG: hypothetical protein R2787_03175 [Saprospiraceae bacterium]